MSESLPVILEVDVLQKNFNNDDLLLIDLSNVEKYREGHIVGAIHLDASLLVRSEKPAMGLLPSIEHLSALFAKMGLAEDTQVVCYDDENGLAAARLVWTLDVIGHQKTTFLNGGKTAWTAAGFPLQSGENTPASVAPRTLSVDKKLLMTADEINARLGAKDFLVWDARSRDEYTGAKVVSAHGGHIPSAIHCEWVELLDVSNAMRFRKDLAQYLQQKGITPDKSIVTHCQTHRRSALTYLAAKSLGYPNIAAYPGSWSEWGNSDSLPIHTGENP